MRISLPGKKDDRILVKLIHGMNTFTIHMWQASYNQVFGGNKTDNIRKKKLGLLIYMVDIGHGGEE